MTFYFSGDVSTCAARVGQLLDAYVADIPLGTLAYYRRDSFKPFTKAMMTRERKQLAALTSGKLYFQMQLRPTTGDASDFEFHAKGDGEKRTASVSLAFPLTEALDPDGFEERFLRYATLSGCESAHAGYDVRNRDNDAYEGIRWNRAGLAERFLGFEGTNAWWSPGRAPPAHWLVWLGATMAGKLGGAKLASEVGEATLRETAAGLALRAAKVPPIAPVNRPDDVGALPDVARALAPLRIQAKGDKNVAHLARWEKIASSPWDNADGSFVPRPSTLTAKAVGSAEPKPKARKRAKKSFFDV